MQETSNSLSEVRIDLDRLRNTTLAFLNKVEDQNVKSFLEGVMYNVRLAFMWCGKTKGSLGAGTPYVHSDNPANKKISPPQDTTKEVSDLNKDVVVALKQLRVMTDNPMKVLESNLNILQDNRKFHTCTENSWTYLCQVRFCLGEALGYIKHRDDLIALEKEYDKKTDALGGYQTAVTKKEEALAKAEKKVFKLPEAKKKEVAKAKRELAKAKKTNKAKEAEVAEIKSKIENY